MDRLTQRIALAKKALLTLQELENEPESKVRRDASIQRFEYSFEAMWKLAKQYLNEIEGLDIGSPKGVIRACFQVNILTHAQAQQALTMADDRNLTSHTYNECLAEEIYGRIKDYHILMWDWLNQLANRLDSTQLPPPIGKS